MEGEDTGAIQSRSRGEIQLFANSIPMNNMRIDIDKFDGSGDYRIWRRKIKALLAQQRLLKAIEDPIIWPEGTTEDQKNEILETATGTLIFHLSDSIIRQIDSDDTPAKIWKRLDDLFQVKSLTNKIFLKERLFGFKMNSSKSLDENLDEFRKLTIELANSGEKESMSDENQAIIILNSLTDTYKEVKSAIKYGRTQITLDEVVSALRSKEFEIKSEKALSSGAEAHYGQDKGQNKKSNKSNKGKSGSKGTQASSSTDGKETRTFFYCKKPGHLKKDCYKWLKKEKDKTNTTISQPDSANFGDGYDSGEVLVISDEKEKSD